MLYKVRSLGLQGISGYEVTAECDLASGLPNFDIVGLPDTAVKEARERVPFCHQEQRLSLPGGADHREPGPWPTCVSPAPFTTCPSAWASWPPAGS